MKYSKTLLNIVLEFTLHQCGCVKFSMPRGKHAKVCNALQADCIIENENLWILNV